MKNISSIARKRLAISQLKAIETGKTTREQAIATVQKRYSSTEREALIEELTKNYDPESIAALHYFDLL